MLGRHQIIVTDASIVEVTDSGTNFKFFDAVPEERFTPVRNSLKMSGTGGQYFVQGGEKKLYREYR